MQRKHLYGFTLLVIMAATTARAEDPATPGVGDLTNSPESLETGADIGLGFSSIGEDSFIELNPGVTFGIGKLEAGLQVPLRFLVIDDPPENDDLIRSQDWDEPSDYLRVVRFIQYAERRDTFFARGGELANTTLGHGTIMNGYNNVVDLNHFQWGVDSAVNFEPGGAEVMLDNIVSPEVMGIRTYARPVYFIDPESFWSKLAFGVSLIGDIDAPSSLLLADDGTFIIDDEGNLVVDTRDSTGVFGLDVELQVFENDLVSVTPYSDVNFLLGHGSGFHLGNLANFTFSEAFELNTRAEFRALGEDYLPQYYDGLYEVERLLFQPLDATGQRRPKLQVVETAPNPAIAGWLASATAQLVQKVLFTLSYDDYEGDDNSGFEARVSLPELGPVTAGAFFLNRNFDGVGEIFELDGALMVAEARVVVSEPFYVIGQFARHFSATPEGDYEPVDDYSLGAGVAFGF